MPTTLLLPPGFLDLPKALFVKGRNFRCTIVENYDYRSCAIISRGLYDYFYPLFHCGLYCRAVRITDNLCVIKKEILQFVWLKSAVYNRERFQIKSGL